MNDENKINAYDLCQAAKLVTNLGADLGLGKGSAHQGSGKALANLMYNAGAISQKTRDTLQNGINKRNSIQHDKNCPKVSEEEAKSMNESANELESKLDNGFNAVF